ncbi:uncharacterized protein JN550_007758 [Neoarthrinium moseri]|uniref:uncharacterized protein n=1 Tax=Neoarthrinium moseri TaxID=1658444 RepID=UPI001FDAECC7|nr:uncharacterized protein JN550_007758 [Neoarthrinium moseri]KAI1866370.1 hypothetical protein JN550_007758 [Neoarthrinium moseri]
MIPNPSNARAVVGSTVPLADNVGSWGLPEVFQQLSFINRAEEMVAKRLLGEYVHLPNSTLEQVAREKERSFNHPGLQALRQEQTELRGRAMDLSRRGIRQMHISDLPEELLYDIFDRVADHCKLSEQQAAVIANSRLVCRQFNQIASRLLCQTLRVRLDRESVDSAVELMQNPLIASGVREVELELSYRPRELATNLHRYTSHFKETLELCALECDDYLQGWEPGVYEGPVCCKQPFEEYKKASDNYAVIDRAWGEYLSPSINLQDCDERVVQYQRIIGQSYVAYRGKHEEQLSLLKEGSFVTDVVNLIAALPKMTRIWFTDKPKFGGPNSCFSWPWYCCGGSSGPSTYLNDREKLQEFLQGTQTWSEIESRLTPDAELMPARILVEVLIGIGACGVLPTLIQIKCFPRRTSPKIVTPESWNNLQTASRRLEVVLFADKEWRAEGPISPGCQDFVDAYLGAILSGPRLERVVVRLPAPQPMSIVSSPLGTTISTIHTSRLVQLSLSDISMTQNDLETLCRKLGDSMESVTLTDIVLSQGSWANPIEILHHKLSKRCQDRKCYFTFWSPEGGEFGRKPRGMGRGSGHEFYKLGIPLASKCDQYVMGDERVTENPLRTTVAEM